MDEKEKAGKKKNNYSKLRMGYKNTRQKRSIPLRRCTKAVCNGTEGSLPRHGERRGEESGRKETVALKPAVGWTGRGGGGLSGLLMPRLSQGQNSLSTLGSV